MTVLVFFLLIGVRLLAGEPADRPDYRRGRSRCTRPARTSRRWRDGPAHARIGALDGGHDGVLHATSASSCRRRKCSPPKEIVVKKDMTHGGDGQGRARGHGGQGPLLHLPHRRQAGAPALPRPRRHRRRARPASPALTDVEYLAQSIYEPERLHRARLQPRHAGRSTSRRSGSPTRRSWP